MGFNLLDGMDGMGCMFSASPPMVFSNSTLFVLEGGVVGGRGLFSPQRDEIWKMR